MSTIHLVTAAYTVICFTLLPICYLFFQQHHFVCLEEITGDELIKVVSVLKPSASGPLG